MRRDISKYADAPLLADYLSDIAHNISGACTILADRARMTGNDEEAEELLDYADDVLDKMRNIPLKRSLLIEAINELDSQYVKLKAKLYENDK